MQNTLFKSTDYFTDKFKRITDTEEYIELFNYLYKQQSEVLYNHSIIYPFSYLNMGRLELYINKDYSNSKIIPVIKKFKAKPNYFMYTPMASNDELMEVINELDKISTHPPFISDVTESYMESFMKLNNKPWKAFKTSDDVVYDTEYVSKLEGKVFAKIRNKIRRITKQGVTMEQVSTLKHKEDAINMLHQWKETQGQKYFRITLGRDIHLVEEYYNKVDNKNVFGIIAYHNDIPVGLVMGCRSVKDKEWGVEITTKGLPEYTGMSDFLRYSILKLMNENGIKYVNDSGYYGPGIKKNKLKWCPIQTIKTFDLKRI